MKQLIAIACTVILLILPTQAFAEAEGTLSYERASALINLHSGTVKKLQRAENDAFKAYRSSVLEMGSMDENGFTIKIDNEEHYIYYGAETRHSIIKMKQIVPEQKKYMWETARDSRIMGERNLEISLRGLFYGIYDAQFKLALKQGQLELASDANRQDEIKLKNGMITSLDLQESGYRLLKAQKEMDEVKRGYDNAARSLNQFVGLPIDTRFASIMEEKEPAGREWKQVDIYVEQALENRFDIINIKKHLALKELDRKLTETGYSYKNDTAQQEAYEKLLNDIEQMNNKLEQLKLTITDEIRNAYVDVVNMGKSVKNAGNEFRLRQSCYKKMQARYESGLITRNALDQEGLKLKQVENSYKAMLYEYNTKIMRFDNATGIGPGY